MPRAPRHLLELNPVQTEQRHLDDENLKLDNHVAANLALHGRRRFPSRRPLAGSSPSRGATDRIRAIVRFVRGRERVVRGCVLARGVAGKLRRLLRRFIIAFTVSQAAGEADPPSIAGWELWALGTVFRAAIEIDAGGVAAAESTFDLGILYAELLEYTDDVHTDDGQRFVARGGHAEEAFQVDRFHIFETLVGIIGFGCQYLVSFFWYVSLMGFLS